VSRTTRRRIERAVWALATVAWVLLEFTGKHSLGLYGDRAGVFVRSKRDFSVSFDVAWGWRSAEWMSRRHVRAPGEHSVRKEFLGWRIGPEASRWNANVSTYVTWLGVQVPGWYCAAVAVAPLLGPWLRARRLRGRRVQRRRRFETWLEAACTGCGYGLRASTERCPECGRRVPGQVLSVRRLGARPPARAGGPAAAAVTGTAPSSGSPRPRG
jgi:predicted RNA-binding Zn-ribbon protein involved in translation (DUF1610 family)